MTVIIERSGGCDRRSEILRKRLLGQGIPSAVISANDLLSVMEKKCVVTFGDVLGNGRENVLVCDGVALTSDDPAVSDREFERISDRITEVLELEFGIRYGMHYGPVYAEDGDRSFFLGKGVPLTGTEKLIVRHLVFSPGIYMTAEEIAAYILADPSDGTSSVSTHVWNVNRKARIVTDLPMIETRRTRGYRFPDPEDV